MDYEKSVSTKRKFVKIFGDKNVLETNLPANLKPSVTSMIQNVLNDLRTAGIIQQNYQMKSPIKTVKKLKSFFGVVNVFPSSADQIDEVFDIKYLVKLFTDHCKLMKQFMSSDSIFYLPDTQSVSDLFSKICENGLCYTNLFENRKNPVPLSILNRISHSFYLLNDEALNLFINVLFMIDSTIPIAILRNHFMMELLYSMLTNGNKQNGGFTYLLGLLAVGMPLTDETPLPHIVDFVSLIDSFMHTTVGVHDGDATSGAAAADEMNDTDEPSLIDKYSTSLQTLYEREVKLNGLPAVYFQFSSKEKQALLSFYQPDGPPDPTDDDKKTILHSNTSNVRNKGNDKGLLSDSVKNMFASVARFQESEYSLNGLIFPIFDDDRSQWVTMQGDVHLFHEYVRLSACSKLKEVCAQLSIPCTDRMLKQVMIIPVPKSESSKSNATSTVVAKYRDMESTLSYYSPTIDHLMPFINCLREDGRVTIQGLEVLIELWSNVIIPHLNGTSNKVTPIHLLDLIYLSGPGYLMKNQDTSETLEELRAVQVASSAHARSSTKSSWGVNDIVMTMQRLSADDRSDSMPVHTSSVPDSVARHRGFLSGLTKFDSQYSTGAASECNQRDLSGEINGTDNQQNVVLAQLYGHCVPPQSATAIWNTLFTPSQQHSLKIYQEYQVVLKKVIVLVMKYCAAHNIVLDNGATSSLETEIEALVQKPMNCLNSTCLNVDLHSVLMSMQGYSVDIGVIALIKIIQNGSCSGHAEVFQRYGKFLQTQYSMEPFINRITDVVNEANVVIGMASARRMETSLLTQTDVMLFILSLIEDCIERFKHDPSQQTNCTALLYVWKATNLKWSNGFFKNKNSNELMEYMAKSLDADTLFSPIIKSPGGDSIIAGSVLNANVIFSADKTQSQTLLKSYFANKPEFGELFEINGNELYFKSAINPTTSKPSLSFIKHKTYNALPPNIKQAIGVVREISRIYHKLPLPSAKSSYKKDSGGRSGDSATKSGGGGGGGASNDNKKKRKQETNVDSTTSNDSGSVSNKDKKKKQVIDPKLISQLVKSVSDLTKQSAANEAKLNKVVAAAEGKMNAHLGGESSTSASSN